VKDLRRLELAIADSEGDDAGEARAAFERIRAIVRDLARVKAERFKAGPGSLDGPGWCVLCGHEGEYIENPDDPEDEGSWAIEHAPTCLSRRAKAAVGGT
jgi:hypothetical protein